MTKDYPIIKIKPDKDCILCEGTGILDSVVDEEGIISYMPLCDCVENKITDEHKDCFIKVDHD